MRRLFSSRVTALFVGLILFLSLPEGACSATVSLSEADCGKSIEATAGDMLMVVLEGNPTTGYTWEAKSGEGCVLKSAGSRYEPARPIPGSPGTFFFSFLPIKPGQAIMEFIYHRPWEKAPPLKSCTLTVIVK
ncbi:MAG TPA: protease inhibitor I42 family protein [Syntrophales bacterium]|mgnify:CR=1 FL=1|nr:protease inhibitor I42 family protein [Syntrophales bacterium]